MKFARNLLLLLLLLVVIAVAAGVIWRHLALETAGKVTLTRFGFGEAALTVEEVGFSRIVAANISLGPDLPSMKRAELDFQPLRLLAGEIERVRLTGLRLVVEGNGENLRSLVRSFAAGMDDAPGEVDRGRGQSAGQGLSLPAVTLADTVVELRGTPAGDGAVQLEGDVALGGDDMHVDLQAALQTGFATAQVVLQTADGADGQVLNVEATGRLDSRGLTAAPAFGENAARWIEKGKADFSLNGQVALPASEADGPAGIDEVLAGRLRGGGQIGLIGVQTAFAPETVDGTLNWTVEGEEGQWRWALPGQGSLTVAGIDPERWRALGLALPEREPLLLRIGPAGGSAEINGNGLGAWQGAGDVSAAVGQARADLSVRAAGNGASPVINLQAVRLQTAGVPVQHSDASGILESLDLSLAGDVTLPDRLDVRGKVEGRVSGVATAHGTLDAGTFNGAFEAGGPVSTAVVNAKDITAVMNGLALPGMAEVAGPLTITGKRVRYANDALEADFEAAAGEAMVLAAGDGAAGPVAWETIAAALTVQGLAAEEPVIGGAVTVAGIAAPVPGADIAISEGDMRLPLADGALSVSLRLADRSGQGRFTPVRVSLDGQRQGQTVTASGNASLHRGQARVPLTLSADMAGQSADVRFGPGVLAFAPGQMQPSDLSSKMKNIRQAFGNVKINGRLKIKPNVRPDITAEVGFDDLSAVLDGGVSVEGLDGDLAFASLQPLATAGEQQLRIRRLVAGVPLEDADARFTIRPDRNGFAVELSEAGAKLSGGQVRVGRAVYRNGSADMRVGIADLPLEQLLDDWKVQGLEGTGLIAGSLPVSIRPGGVAIEGGQLMSLTPGVIRVDFGSARQTLAGAGSQVELAVQTLENFHYDRMTLGVSKPLDGELSLAVSLNGKNPDVLDGYPFRFNVNLSGKVEPILDAIQAGERISTDLLQGSLGQ